MFRRTRMFTIALFILSVCIFAGYNIYQRFIIDKSAPMITMDEQSIHLNCGASDEEILFGVSAKDNKDGDVSDSLMIETKTNFIEPGRFNVSIVAYDKNGNISKATREVIYDDYESPTISGIEELRFPVSNDSSKVSASSILSRLQAQDKIEGNISNRMQLTYEENVLVNRPGDYKASVSVTNSFGDVTTVPITITIYDPQAE